ncbi:MAG TPA: S41 family peptidase [Blastocatellia bacterium]|nr:S41 family peptidase [Blastocatellia bacterium]
MKHLLKASLATLFVALLCLTFSLAAQTPAIPDTPAGRTLQAWLDAFNSGDRGRLEAYLTKYEPAKSVDSEFNFRNQTGGFELVRIAQSDRLHIEFQVKEKAGPTNAVGKIEVKDADPAVVVSFRLRAIPPGMTAADMNMKIDAATRARVIDGAVAKLNEFYVFPETAKKMAEAVQARLKSGAYDATTDAEDFAAKLTEDLRAVSHDKHLGVNFSAQVIPKREPGANPPPDPATQEQRRAQALRRNNCAFEKVEWLPSNIGYLKFNGFAGPELCGPTVTIAMNFLANVDALIIDLRGNGGGSPEMVAYICSYLFAERTHLNDLYNRKEDKTTEFWTKDVPGPRLAKQPVFVLTSKRTFSGAEEFTYNLKNLKRATIIGETTGGGAHPVSGHRIDDHFGIGVPFARAINPITKTNWEGTGVEPDIKVPASEALEVAKKMAAEQIRNR